MDFRFDEEQTRVRELARGILEKEVGPERVKSVEQGSDWHDARLWQTLADAGLLGITVAEAEGGMGLGLLELCVLLEEIGRVVAPVPALPATRGGVVRDVAGAPVGTHRGVHRFTVGQRRGLGLATGQPLYVVQLHAETQTVVVGPRGALERTGLRVADVNWIEGAAPPSAIRASVQIRHKHQAAPATVTATGCKIADVVFDTPQTAITPGQAAVFYDGDVVLGGGWISDPTLVDTP